MRHICTLFFVATLVLLAGGCSIGPDERFEARGEFLLVVDHVPGTAIDVETRNGAIEILRDETIDAVEIACQFLCRGVTQEEADIRLAQAVVTAERSGDGVLSIDPVFPDGPGNSESVSITVHIPDALGVGARTGNGSVTVRGMGGRLVVQTSNGAITAADQGGGALLETSNGRVTARNIDGATVIRTSNGAVTCRAIGGALDIVTSNGAVSAAGVAGATTLRSSNGAITLALGSDGVGPITAHSSNGAVSVTVGSQFAGLVALLSESGKVIVTDEIGTAQSTSEDRGRADVQVGAGDAESRISSSNGTVELRVTATGLPASQDVAPSE